MTLRHPTARPAEPFEGRYADGSYLRDNPGWHEADAAWKAAKVRGLLSEHGIVPARVCDLGCGTGAVLEELARDLPPETELVGFEPSDDARGLASSERRARVDLRARPGPNERFDVMLMLDVFEHVEEPYRLLRENRSRARWAVFHVPLDINVQTVVRATPLIAAREQLGHLHYFTAETAQRLLEDAGFPVADARVTAPRVELPAPSRRAALARPPRALLWRLSPALAARWLGGFELLVLAGPLTTADMLASQ